jgi:hypothetical protein
MAESERNDWRALCAAAAKEEDPAKLNCLVSQIIESLEHRNLPNQPSTRASSTPASSNETQAGMFRSFSDAPFLSSR